MRIDRMLWHCLVPGACSFEEKGIQVELVPRPGETILLFQTDGPAFRDYKQGVKTSDLLLFVRGPSPSLPVLLFVELKGSDSDLAKAEEQLKNAILAVLGQLAPDCMSTTSQPAASPRERIVRKDAAVRIRALVVFGAAAIENTKGREKALFRETGVVFRYHYEARTRRPTDLRPYLPAG